MALLGAQLVITLIAISIIQKLGPHFSLGRWLLCSTGLIRYLYPTNQELKQLANIPKENKGKKKDKAQTNGQSKPFHIPRNLQVQLDTAKITNSDVVLLRYYVEYQWLIDFALYSGLVYVTTEVYQIFFPITDEINLSMLWCGLVLIFSVKVLGSLTVQYFTGPESVGERSTCIVMGFVYLLISMIILTVDNDILELGLDKAYVSFNKSASDFLSKQGVSSSGPASMIVLKFFLALWCGILGAIVTFPGLRIAKMHWDLVKNYQEMKIVQLFLNLTFALPFVLVVLWIKPVSKHYLTVRIFSGLSQPLLTEEEFEAVRLIAIVLTIFIKIALMPWYLQAYLNMAYHKTEEQKKEAGRITNVDFQRKIAAVFYYLCVVALQYIAPLILCLYFGFMYKTLGEFSWSGGRFTAGIRRESILTEAVEQGDSVVDNFHMALENFKAVFTVDVFRGLFGFATWWSCFLYFASTSLGLIYQTYFTRF